MAKKRSFRPKRNLNSSNNLTGNQAEEKIFQQSKKKLQHQNGKKKESKNKSNNHLSSDVLQINGSSPNQFAGDNLEKDLVAKHIKEENLREKELKSHNESKVYYSRYNRRDGALEMSKELDFEVLNASSKKLNGSNKKFYSTTATQFEKDDFLKLEKVKSRRSNRKCSCKNAVSPTCGVRLCPKKNIIITFSSTKHLSTDIWETVFNVLHTIQEEYLTKISYTIFKLFLWIGSKIKKIFGILWEIYSLYKQCKIENNEMHHLLLLNSSIHDLKLELRQSKHENNEKIDQLTGEFDKIHQRLLNIQEQQVSRLASASQPILSCCTPIPPPPPPPPPPQPSTLLKTFNILPIKQKQNPERNNTRPIISLDDILNVKLKKISDRPISSKTECEIFNNLKFQLKSSRGNSPFLKRKWSPISNPN